MAAVVCAAPARAAEPPSDEASDDGTLAPASPAPVDSDAPPESRTEVAALPSASWDSDLGAGFGLLGSIARFEPGWAPWRWRLEASASMAVRDGGGAPEVPLYAGQLKVDLPARRDGGARVDARVVARRALADYYGVGNASSGRRPDDAVASEKRYFRYWRLWLAFQVGARVELMEGLHLRGLGSFAFNRVEPTPGGTLDLDRKGRSGPWVTEALVGTGTHGLLEGTVGVEWDTRDNEAMPSSGMYHRASVRLGIGDQRIAFPVPGPVRPRLPLARRPLAHPRRAR